MAPRLYHPSGPLRDVSRVADDDQRAAFAISRFSGPAALRVTPSSGVEGGTAAPGLEFWTHRGGAFGGNGQKAAWPWLGTCVALSPNCAASDRWALGRLCPPSAAPVCSHSSPLLLAQEPKIERTCHSCPSQPRKGQVVSPTLVV